MNINKHPLLTAHIGLLLLALPIPLLLFPSKTPIGGVPGLAALLFFLTGWSPGLITLVLFLLCFLLAQVTLGSKRTLQSIYASTLLSLLVEGIYRLCPLTPVEHPYLAWPMQTLAAGLMGIGLLLTVKADYPPAGTAVLSVILSKFTPLGVLFWLIVFDLAIALATAIWMDWLTAARTLFGIVLMYAAYRGTQYLIE